jgi:hypothetical protein
MLISRVAGLIALCLAGLTASAVAQAAPSETQHIDGWTLNAWTADKTGVFRSCTMRAPGNDQVLLNIGQTVRGRWFLSLYRSKWDLEQNDRFIATLNFDQDQKKPLALDARVNSEHFLALVLTPDKRTLDRMAAATTVRISREKQAYTFTLSGYDKAVQWVKECVSRNATQEASKPDGTIRNEDDDAVEPGGTEGGQDKPAEAPSVKPKLAPGVIETKADEPQKPPIVADISPTAPPARLATVSASSSDVEKPAGAQQIASVATTTSTPPISDAAKASMPVIEPPASIANPAQALLPSLMSAANRADFKLLDNAAAPAALKRGDVVFSLADLTGVVMTIDLPTAAAAINEVVAYDRVACAGAYTADANPVADGQADVLHAMSECKTADKSVLSHYLTLSRKAGGFYVVALTSETTASASGADTKLADIDRALFDAAIKVSGKF